MECKICKKEIDINWGSSLHTLCEEHSDSLGRIQNPNNALRHIISTGSDNQNKEVKAWNRIFLVLYTLALVPWFGISVISIMAFDSPGSGKSIYPWLFVGFVWSYPIWAGIFCIVSAVLYDRGKYRKSVLFSVMP
ncbi:MAG: hypothetical protein GY746_00365, partial [Gammaproteobacteria bacterium]|nr:hypothetical protein [Gammaproteobacteria bacterium]